MTESCTAAPQGAPLLFQPFDLRGVSFRNRVWIPPMCQYSVFAHDGVPTSWHYQHYVSRALGGAGLVIAESTAVDPEGRITPNDVGLWNDNQQKMWQWIVDGITAAGAVPGIQLNHAGRKASAGSFDSGFEDQTVPADAGGWTPLGPSPLAFGNYSQPDELTVEQIRRIVDDFRNSARRAVDAGFKVIEIHGAHGYLASQFLDPLSNQRTDQYGGSFENRIRFLLEVTDAVRQALPDELPLFVRLSATDWAEPDRGGWDLAQTVELSKILKAHGVDLIDVSTGGILPDVTVPVGPNYQVPFAQAIRQQAEIPTTAVGLITEPEQAEDILRSGAADAIEIGRVALREPYWAFRAAHELGLSHQQIPYPKQYRGGAWRDEDK